MKGIDDTDNPDSDGGLSESQCLRGDLSEAQTEKSRLTRRVSVEVFQSLMDQIDDTDDADKPSVPQ